MEEKSITGCSTKDTISASGSLWDSDCWKLGKYIEKALLHACTFTVFPRQLLPVPGRDRDSDSSQAVTTASSTAPPGLIWRTSFLSSIRWFHFQLEPDWSCWLNGYSQVETSSALAAPKMKAARVLGKARTSAGSGDNERTCFRRTLLTHSKTLVHLCPTKHTHALEAWALSWPSDPPAASSCPPGCAVPQRVTEAEPGLATRSGLKHLLSYIPPCSVLSGYNYRIRPLGIKL